jgi:hypothetical protein
VNNSNRFPLKTLLLLTLAGAIALSGNLPQAAVGQTPPSNTLIQFNPPQGDLAPRDRFSDSSRGDRPFAPLEHSARRNTRGEIVFRPPRKPAPRSTVGSGVRGEQSAQIVPLLPETQAGYTVSPRPTLYLYVPPTPTRQVFFSLQDENFEPHYHTILHLSGRGGIVSVTLPEDVPALETGKYYAWFFAPLEADGILRPDNYSARGWIKRVEAPSTTGELTPSTPLERAVWYAHEGIWYDTLTQLVSAQQAQPDNETIAQTWRALLEQVGLEAIARSPITEQL